MAVADPRSSVRFRGIGQVNATFPTDNSTITYLNTAKNGSTATGYAVTINSSGQLVLAADGQVIVGKLLRVNGDNFATVQIAGAMFLPPGTGQTIVPGAGVVGALGAANALGFIRQLGLPATGTIGMASQPANTDTVVINGVTCTAVTAIGATAGNFLIDTTAALTLKNLLSCLQNTATGAGTKYIALTAGSLSTVSVASFALNAAGTAIVVTYNTVGTTGNGFTLTKTGTVITVSGATLTGGTNGLATDAFYQTGITLDTGTVNDLIQGVATACYTIYKGGA